MREKQLARMTRWAEPYLGPAESLQLAVWGPDSALKYFLTGTAKGRVVAISERNLYVFGSSAWGRMSKATSLIARHPLGSVPVRVHGWKVRAGDEQMMVHLHLRNRAQELAAAANAAPAVPGSRITGRRAR